MNKKILWGLEVVVFILVIAAGILYYQAYHSLSVQTAVNQNIPSQITPTPSSTTVNSSSTSNITSGWTQYTDPHSGITFNHPNSWIPNSDGNNTYFVAPIFTSSSIDVLDIAQSTSTGTLEQAAQAAIVDNDCPALDDNGQPADHVISNASSGILIVLNCSISSATYEYITYNPEGKIVEMGIHDAWSEDIPEDQTPSIVQAIIASVH